MMKLLSKLLERVICTGTLTVIDCNGGSMIFGDGGVPKVTVRIHNSATALRLALYPQLYLGEAYMDGRLTIEDGALINLLELIAQNTERTPTAFRGLGSILPRWLLSLLHEYNPAKLSARHVKHHYDLNTDLFDTFLDSSRQYSCAYFQSPNDDLETAQQNKKERIAQKLLLSRDQHVLDIGSGWGGLALHLAQSAEVNVHGLTLSSSQCAEAAAQAWSMRLDRRCRFELMDYREVDGIYDRIVSVGMFEHVGRPHYAMYFRTIAKLLAEDGVALIHTIGRTNGPGQNNPWLRKYIFPGGYTPALSEIVPHIENAGLLITDIEVLRLHYAETLRHWRERFAAQRDRVREQYDERFCRMWEFYLCICEMAFRYDRHVVFQLQLAKRQDAVPLTRSYLGMRTGEESDTDHVFAHAKTA